MVRFEDKMAAVWLQDKMVVVWLDLRISWLLYGYT